MSATCGTPYSVVDKAWAGLTISVMSEKCVNAGISLPADLLAKLREVTGGKVSKALRPLIEAYVVSCSRSTSPK